jgi:pimeloyl-ACP methyl ester carboxylesterase
MKLNYKSYGHGPALVILHGMFGSLDNWVTHARALADSFSVYLVDQRNHGKSPHTEEMDYHILANDLFHFLDRESIYVTHLLGHSMGGKTVMQFAAEHPDRVEKMIIADMGLKAYPPLHSELLRILLEMDLDEFGSRQEAEDYLSARIPDPAVQQFLLKNLKREGNEAFKWKFNLKSIVQNYPKILQPIEPDFPCDKPALFISGGASDYVLPSDRPLILNHFPNARFEVIPGAGHWLHSEAPDAFLKSIKHFLQGAEA